MGESDALKSPAKKNPYADGFQLDFGRLAPKNKQPGASPALPAEAPASKSQAAKNPYKDGFALDYNQLNPQGLKNIKPGAAQPGEIVAAKGRDQTIAGGFNIDGLRSRLQQSAVVDLGNIPLDRNGRPQAEVLPGRDSKGYFITLHYKDDLLSPNTRYYFGAQLQTICLGGVEHPANGYRKIADNNYLMQKALHASDETMRKSGIRPFDANSGLDRIDRWARGLTTDIADPRAKASLAGALKTAEVELTQVVNNYPNEPYSKIRLAQVLFAESFNVEDAKSQRAMQVSARQLLIDAERISRLQSTGSYDASYIPAGSVGYTATPIFEGAVAPSSYWLGAQSQAAQCINQFSEFFQRASHQAYQSNVMKSPFFYSKYPNSFSTSPRPYGSYGQGYNSGYRNTFSPTQYPSGVPYINTGE